MSKKNVSGFVSVMGALQGFITNFLAAFTKRGGTDEDLHQLLVGSKSEDFINQISDLAMKMVKKAKPAFPIFKTITLGVYESVKAYREALTKAGFRIGDWATDILNKIQVSQSQVQLDLVMRSVAELGFEEAARYDAIYAKAKELGLQLCPAEVGPALRLTYSDQPCGEWLWIAMDPLPDSYGGLVVFGVAHARDGRVLAGDDGVSAYAWGPDGQFVFVLPRK